MGATGATGNSLVDLLIQSPLYNEIHIVHYRPTNIAKHPKIIEHIINMDRLIDQLHIESPIHDVFCTIGTTRKKAKSAKNFIRVDLDYVIELGIWAKNRKVNHFSVISSTGANENSFFLYLKTKGKMEKKLIDMEFPQLNIFRPPLLYAPDRKESRLTEKMTYPVLEFLSKVIPPLFKKQKPLPVDSLAKKMLSYSQEENEGLRILEPLNLQ